MERVEGVREAQFSWELAEGFVTYDTTLTSAEVIVAELERLTGFLCKCRSAGRGAAGIARPTR